MHFGKIWKKFHETIKKRRLLSPSDKALIAISGGPDSVCLTRLLLRWAELYRGKLHLIHFNHGLRKSANKDQRLVEKLAKNWKLPLTTINLPVKKAAQKGREGLESAGRKLRYRALLQLAKKLKFNKIATGHTLDDQAETVLLNLIRGSGRKGLTGIPPKRPLHLRNLGDSHERWILKAYLIRPLVEISKKEIFSFLKQYKIPYRMDPTNKSKKFLRNRIRHELIPLLEKYNPRIRKHIARLATPSNSNQF